MTKLDKLLRRLFTKPKDFTYSELRTVLTSLGYKEFHKGKTSGSRVAFYHETNQHIIRLHKPHPGNELKQYTMNQVVGELQSQGYLV